MVLDNTISTSIPWLMGDQWDPRVKGVIVETQEEHAQDIDFTRSGLVE